MTQTKTLEPTTIKDDSQTKVCFVCTGNTCRSPMAAAVLNSLGKGKYVAESAGILADKGAPMTDKAIAALQKAGIDPVAGNDYTTHTARQLNSGILDSADLIVGVGAGHAMMIIQSYPLFASKITAFPKAVTDPFGQSQEVYDRCLAEITEQIKAMFQVSGGQND